MSRRKLILAFGMVLTLTGCFAPHSTNVVVKESETTVETDAEVEQTSGIKIASSQASFDFSLVETLPEEPDWENTASAMQQLLEYTIPEELEKQANAILSKRIKVGPHSSSIILDYCINNNVAFTIYKDAIASDTPSFTLGVEPTALFQHNNNLVVATFLSHTRSLLLYTYDENGLIAKEEKQIDTFLLDFVKVVGTAQDFTVIYDTHSKELVCIQYGIALGKGFKTSQKCLQALYQSSCWNTGFIYDNTLIFPILFKNETGIRFELCEIAKPFVASDTNLFTYLYLDPMAYNVYNNELYLVTNAYDSISLYNYNGNEPITIQTIVVKEDELNIQKENIDYDAFRDIQLSHYSNNREGISINFDFGHLYGEFTSTYQLDEMVADGCFKEYMTPPPAYDACYNCKTWTEAMEIIDFSKKHSRP